MCEQNPTLELVARRNWSSYMFKDGKHELYSATRTQIVSCSLKQRIIQRSYYRLLLCNHCCSKIICHAFVDFTTHCNLLDFVPSIGLWGLVNNAGKLSVGMIELQPLDSFKRIADVNLWGTIFVTQTFLPLVKKARGRIVNIGSILGEIMITMKTLEVKTRNSSR